MTEPDFQSLYEARMQEFGASYRANGHSPRAYRLRRTLYRHVLATQLPPAARDHAISVLDAGCGNGAMSDAFREQLQISRLVGVDYVPEACQIAERVYQYDRAVPGNVLELPKLVGETFDLVNSCEVFLYIAPEQRGVFWKAHAAMLKPGGWMILLVPNLQSLFRKLKPINSGWGYPFTLDSIRQDLRGVPRLRLLSAAGVSLATGRTFDLPTDRAAPLKRLLAFEIALVLQHDSTG